MVSYSVIPSILSLISFFILSFFLLILNWQGRAKTLLLCICVFSGMVCLDSLYLFNTDNRITALWISRVDHLFLVFLVPLYLHFAHEHFRVMPTQCLIPIGYWVAVLLAILVPTPWLIADVLTHPFGLYGTAGPLYPLFGISWFGTVVYVSIMGYGAIKNNKNGFGRKRLCSLVIGLGGLGVLNGLNILPVYGVSVFPPSHFGFIPLWVIAFGLLRYDIVYSTDFANRNIIYSTFNIFLTCIYAFIITVVAILFRRVDSSRSFFFSFFFFLLVVLIFGPLKVRIQSSVNKLFYRHKYDYRKTLRTSSRMILSILDIQTIGRILTRTIAGAMRVSFCHLIIIPTETGRSYYFSHPRRNYQPETFADTNRPLIRYLMAYKRPAIKSELFRRPHRNESTAIVKDMDTFSASLAVPLLFKDQFKGYFLIGSKQMGSRFTREDVDLLEALSGQGALALENARSYEKIETLNRDLEKKIAERTHSLQEMLKEKERAQEQLIRSESLASIGQLVAGVAHELNNPLASAVSLIQTVIEDLEQLETGKTSDKEIISDLIFADRELRRAREIVSSLLGLSRQSDSFSEKVSINSVVRDALRVLQNQYKHRSFAVVEKYGEKLPIVHGNVASLGQVILNIVQNAYQAMEGKRTSVEIETLWDVVEDRVVFRCLDTGPGIPVHIQKDIFKPFFTTKDPGKGTGMGLYISHEIIRKHGGELRYFDHEKGGAGFIVNLPVPTEHANKPY